MTSIKEQPIDNREPGGHITDRIVDFLSSIGLTVVRSELNEPTRLPGLHVQNGTVFIDQSKLQYPGDLLHEAGHLAVISAEKREQINGDFGDDMGMETAAMAWSYAAAVHLGITPEIVFHDGGYFGWSKAFVENFQGGRYVGVPILVWLDMTGDPNPRRERTLPAFPEMTKWLCD
ncbi:MAG TPA: hypothetical protein VFC63_19920 [Blastocatellia bacterium]|nr:hypothetical protein [Blastocatellia bacterium]